MIKDSICKDGKLYQCKLNVGYIVESDSIMLVSQDTGNVHRIDYPYAAIWDFMCRKYSVKRIIYLLTYICQYTEGQAKLLIDEFIKKMCSENFMEEV